MTNEYTTTPTFPTTLAPMAGYTDSTFRLLCQHYGADSTTSEMISATALTMGDRKTASLAKIAKTERTALQIFGHDPRTMAKAAEILLSGNFPDQQYNEYPIGIDINMGCPVRKIYTSGDGSALLENLPLAREITERTAEVCQKYNTPLSVKIRLGITNANITAPEFAKTLAQAGADKITLHCRTKEQMYAPSAAPRYCKDVKSAINTVNQAKTSTPPTILCGNGDITDRQTALAYINNTCDEVAVGRAALGQPWIFREIKNPAAPKMTKDEIIDITKAFVSAVAAEKGELTGIRESRSRAAHFIKGMPGSAKVRDKLNHAETLADFCQILTELKNAPIQADSTNID